MNNTEHHRLFSRADISFRVKLTFEDGTIVLGDTGNVGLGGLLVVTDEKLSDGHTCTIAIELSKDLEIESRGEVLRTDEQGVTIKFTAVRSDDLDHFDALIRYNLKGDDGLVEDTHNDDRPVLELY